MILPVMKIVLCLVPDLLLALGLGLLLYHQSLLSRFMVLLIMGCVLALALLRLALSMVGERLFYRRHINVIKEFIRDLKKGKFAPPKWNARSDGDLTEVYNELVIAGKNLENIVSSQKEEIDNYHELYNSIIFSISSYFLILDDEARIVFANEGFFKKFQLQRDDIVNRKIDEIFYFVNARLRGGIVQVKKTGRSVVLEKNHLSTLNKVSIIADIKISTIVVKGDTQIIIIIDDVTRKLRNDYQISLMSQISESIQKDDEIGRVLHTILTGVTSGAGLGFNRAMLFLGGSGYLTGRMAVGPDSFEEAIDIWSSVSASGNLLGDIGTVDTSSGRLLLDRVQGISYPLSDENVFTDAFREMKSTHIFDAWNDPTVAASVREFMDVKEFVIVPLIVKNRSIGVIVADNKFNQAPIGRDSIELLLIFASQAAMSIESYQNLDHVKREMQKISEKQDAIVESEKLAAVGRIASHLAHEIRNPLVTMGGYARRVIQLSKDSVRKGDSIAMAAEIILKESERLEKTLSNVMDFTRPTKFIREFNSINAVIIDTTDLLKNIFLEKRIDIQLSLAENLPLVKSDFNQMKQVMLNLLQNAQDATPAGGVIGITTKFDGAYISIMITDTGSGINQEDPNIIFEPFFTTKVTGVGLGLAIVKKIVKDHSGEIRVNNRPEGGVEFIIRLAVPG